MTDWDEMVMFIRGAIEAVDDAHLASQRLKDSTNRDSFAAFRRRMEELEEHLHKLKAVLDNEEAFAMDELMDALSKAYSGHAADYRKTPRMNG